MEAFPQQDKMLSTNPAQSGSTCLFDPENRIDAISLNSSRLRGILSLLQRVSVRRIS